MYRLVCLIIGYCIGCVQTAYIFGRATAHIDIREHGSGNAGTNNVARVLGVVPGAFVFLIDCFKAVLAFILCGWLIPSAGFFLPGGLPVLPGFYAGIGVLLGHNFPFYLKFKGGKGIASSIGLIFCVDWRAGLIAAAAGLIALLATWYISLLSIVILILFPCLLLLFRSPAEPLCLAIFMALMAVWQHRGNIGRLAHGTEKKFSIQKKKT
jgi:glycerol-3-phosphate acyltransferase PlsY